MDNDGDKLDPSMEPHVVASSLEAAPGSGEKGPALPLARALSTGTAADPAWVRGRAWIVLVVVSYINVILFMDRVRRPRGCAWPAGAALQHAAGSWQSCPGCKAPPPLHAQRPMLNSSLSTRPPRSSGMQGTLASASVNGLPRSEELPAGYGIMVCPAGGRQENRLPGACAQPAPAPTLSTDPPCPPSIMPRASSGHL